MLVQLAQLSIAISGHALLWLTVCWLAASAFWLWTLIDCLVSGRVRDRTKLVWVLV